MRIGIYIGSFDPFHNGHIKIIKEILKEDIVDKIFIIPTEDYWNKTINLDLEKRFELIELSLKNKIPKDKYYIDKTLGKYPYTYLLFRQLKKDYPNDELYLIMGGDNIPKFNKWKHYKELTQYNFIVVNRNTPDLEKQIIRLKPKSYYLLEVKGISDISSTYIRDNIEDYNKIKKMINKKEYEFVYINLKEQA